jgi:hypothetical protein
MVRPPSARRPGLANDGALFVEDEWDRVGGDAAARDGGLGQGVVDLRFGQPQQRGHELLARMYADLQPHIGQVARSVQLQIQDGRHLTLVGQRQVDGLDLLLQGRDVGQAGCSCDFEHV